MNTTVDETRTACSRKEHFQRREGALAAIHAQYRRRNSNTPQLFVYRCPDCDRGWVLTHAPQNQTPLWDPAPKGATPVP